MKKWITALFVLLVMLTGCQSNDEAENSDQLEIELEEEAAAEETEQLYQDPTGMLVTIDVMNEAEADSDLTAALERLQAIVTEKNTEKLEAMLQENITYTFGESPGKEGFLKEWQLDTLGGESPFWNEVADMLELGGAFLDEEQKTYMVPYAAARFPAEYDPSQYGAIVGDKVNMRAQPTTDSEVVSQLSYEMVKISEPVSETYKMNGRTYHWLPVETTLGTTGYVVEKFVRSPNDFRMTLTQAENGSWEISTFISGDES